MKKVFILASICLIAIFAKPKWHELENYDFSQYVQDFQKEHMLGSDEYVSKEQIFNENLADIKSHNQEGHSWKKGVNQFTDMTQDEFDKVMFGNTAGMREMWNNDERRILDKRENTGEKHKSFDWRDHGVVTPVKDQGHCGSCWAHASVETIESQAAIVSDKLIVLSQQQLTSCVTNGLKCGGTGGCSGSIAQLAFTYAEVFKITSEEAYPYFSGNGTTGDCAYDAQNMPHAAQVMGHRTLPFNDQDALEQALIEDGPIAISAWASPWKSYEEGIFTGCDFSTNIAINHAIQLTGWTADYWIVRNSWGPDWGERGYIYLERTALPECGICSTPGDGAACVNDGQVTQTVCGQCGMLSNSVTLIDPSILSI